MQTDFHKNSYRLGLAADYISNNRDLLMSLWEQKVRNQIEPAKDSSQLILRDHLGVFLYDLSNSLSLLALTPGNSQLPLTHEISLKLSELYTKIYTKNRNQSCHYFVHHVAEEYVILRHVVTDFLIAEGLLDLHSAETINRMFENSTLKAIKVFQKQVDKKQHEMVASIAHDMRSPIAIAQMSLKPISDYICKAPETTRKFYQMGMESIDESLSMSVQILDSLSIDARSGMKLKFEKVDLVPVLDKVVRSARCRFGERLVFLSPKGRAISGFFAMDLLVRVTNNLISNAFKYGSDTENVSIGIAEKNDSVSISVHNDGCTISEDNQKDIFHLFKSEGCTNEHSGSWGIGLTHVKFACKAHGGKAKLVSSDEKGTTFTLTLKKEFNKNSQGTLKLM